jgi:hypothetical protein
MRQTLLLRACSLAAPIPWIDVIPAGRAVATWQVRDLRLNQAVRHPSTEPHSTPLWTLTHVKARSSPSFKYSYPEGAWMGLCHANRSLQYFATARPAISSKQRGFVNLAKVAVAKDAPRVCSQPSASATGTQSLRPLSDECKILSARSQPTIQPSDRRGRRKIAHAPVMRTKDVSHDEQKGGRIVTR